MISAKRGLKLAFWQSITGLWGSLLFSLMASILVITGAGIEQFKISILAAMLLTLVLLLHRDARHFLLIPAGIAVMCSLFAGLRYAGYF
ncbi:conserved hypothetical protein; putative membrane protein [Xenorhabdus bovienii str. puntauvense]|uniref:DUF1435 domain-containing protein n=2 Tax=Xenorhabdus bovienii TaxID=40576 RepID=A0A077NAY6_XENBV|nr:DUF1435 family protein [Xenorhabdus bovienii]MCG3460776.1 DUF1435 family protein [Xenorhabdus bovienii]CDG95433.1 conserved hypothetical protein; putative membrane protein [Xenorhabdus bovienii str. puntauvense]CDH26539.1 conserved hypothetical protein; putative membrane protein [Xenorhabdus bovienii str. kraussei Becker Underwood]